MAFNLQLDSPETEVEGSKDDLYPEGDGSVQIHNIEISSMHSEVNKTDKIHGETSIAPGYEEEKNNNSSLQSTSSNVDSEENASQQDDEMGTESSSDNGENVEIKDHQVLFHPDVQQKYEGTPIDSCLVPSTSQRKIGQSTSSSRRLSAHETLAARLNRIERDRDHLRKDLSDIKNSLKENSREENNGYDNISNHDSLEQVQRRISLVENFLSGFGVLPNENIVANHSSDSSQLTRQISNNTSPCGDDICNDFSSSLLDETISIAKEMTNSITNSANVSIDERGSASTGIETKLHRTSLSIDGASSKVPALDFSSPLNIKENVDDASIPMGLEPTNMKNDKSPGIVEGQQNHPTNSCQNDSQTTQPCISGEPVQENDSHIESSGRTVQSANSEKGNYEAIEKSKCSRNSSFSKRQQHLMMYLVDQEERFKEDISQILERIMDLEKYLERQVSKILSEKPASDLEPKRNDSKETTSDTNGAELATFVSSELDSLHKIVEKMTEDIDTKATIGMVKKEISTHLFEASQTRQDSNELSHPIPANFSHEDINKFKVSVQQQLRLMNDQKVDKEVFLKELSITKESAMKSLSDAIGNSETKTGEHLRQIQNDVDACKVSISAIENKSYEGNAPPYDLNIDERIRDATLTLQSNLNETFSSRLDGLKQVEVEMEKVTSQLAEKPDQDQINTMLQDLERSVLKHVGIDDDLKSVLDGVKTDLRQKLTKEQVLGLVKQLLRGAKEGITKNTASLMVGYKCLGCNEIHPHGVNQFIAAKVNHNALPYGRNGTSPIYPYYRSSSDPKVPYNKRSLAPLRKTSSTSLGSRYSGRTNPRPKTSPYQTRSILKGNR